MRRLRQRRRLPRDLRHVVRVSLVRRRGRALAVTRADYLRARGWERFRGDVRWYPLGATDGISEEEAERIQLDRDEAAMRYLLERRPGALAYGIAGVAALDSRREGIDRADARTRASGAEVGNGSTEAGSADLGSATEPPATNDLDGEAGQ